MRWGTLFAGIDGVGFGLKQQGHHVVWAVEQDATAAEYHRRNHPDTRLYEQSVQDVDVTELANIECLWASPPCQAHSQARRTDLPARDDAEVGLDILRYADELQPRIIMIENVPGYARHRVCKRIVAGLLDMGYAVESRILNCADYGIPQTRERLIIQARKDGRIAWPVKAARRIGWYEAIADILPPPEKPLAPWQAKRWDEAYNALGPMLLDNQLFDGGLRLTQTTEPANTVMAYHGSCKNIVYPVLCDGQFKYGTNDAGEKVLNLLAVDSPSPTVVASDRSSKDRCVVYPVIVDNQYRFDGMRLLDPRYPSSTITASDGIGKEVVYPAGPMRARLTIACNARLQTFPDDVILPPTFSAAIRLIGNAVPPVLAQQLAACAETGANIWQHSLFDMAMKGAAI